jgi:HTH-type transcriptional regulator/antitoxin HigA
MDELGTTTLSPCKYSNLLNQVLPKVIETDEELEHFVEILEALDTSPRRLTREETAMQSLLEQLIQVYDDKIQLPDVPPLRMLQYLMEQRGLRQADLLPVFGSRSIASTVLNGKRELSKTHIRRLAEFFHVSPAVFL